MQLYFAHKQLLESSFYVACWFFSFSAPINGLLKKDTDIII